MSNCAFCGAEPDETCLSVGGDCQEPGRQAGLDSEDALLAQFLGNDFLSSADEELDDLPLSLD